MTDAEKIAKALAMVRGTEGISRQVQPERQTRAQGDIERAPDWSNRVRPAEGGRGDWGGGVWRGGSFGGHEWSGGRDK